MILSITGEFPLCVANINPDTEVKGSRMSAAELKVGSDKIPCIIRHVAFGNIKMLEARQELCSSIMIFKRIRHTKHNKKGFVDVQITTKAVQFSVYIHTDHLKHFLGACLMAMVPTN